MQIKANETALKEKASDFEKKIAQMEEERKVICEEAVAREKELLAAVASAERVKGDGSYSGASTAETSRKIKVLFIMLN